MRGSYLHWISNTALHITFLSYDIPFTGKQQPNNLTSSQLCDFVAQLISARTGIAEVMGSNPVESPEFFRIMRQLLVQQVRGSYLHLILNTALHITLISYVKLYIGNLAFYHLIQRSGSPNIKAKFKDKFLTTMLK